MDNQHKLIKGYRSLSEYEIAVMNEIKTKAEEVRVLIDKFNTIHPADNTAMGMSTDLAMVYNNVDKRWVAIARTHLQEGFMALTRSVAKPESF